MSLTHAESRARAALVHDVHTRVHLDLTSTDRVPVEATLTFTCRADGSDTFVEFAEASDVVLSGTPQHAEYSQGRIHLRSLAAGTHELTVRGTVPYVTDGDGITAVTDTTDGQRYVSTYTAMDIAQKVLPCFDQPDLKSTFEVSVTGEEHWTVLANGLFVSREENTWHFAPTPPIASYLFFVAAGPWVSRTWDEPYALAPTGSLPFGWHARASQEAALDREFAWLKALTSAAFGWYTDAFDEPYPFADYQQVFTPGLNWGAMEFPGCVAFRDEYLTPGEPTAIQRQQLSSVICHEMAHMWFGDLVTMQWWEDSWLNESFADYMGYRVSGEIGYSTGWTMATLTRKPTAYRADSRRSTHPIAEDAENLVDVDTAFANFDMITYAKGSAVLHQLVTWLGEEAFLAGVNAHLSAHRFGNATLADFLDALDAATDRDVRAWATAWLRTTGYDTVHLDRDGEVPVLRRTGTRPHRFTVTGFDDTGSVALQRVVDLADAPVALPDFVGLHVLPNSENEAYADLALSAADFTALIDRVASLAAPQHRAMVWALANERVHRGENSVEALTRAAATSLVSESDPTVFEGAVALVLGRVRSHSVAGVETDEAVERLAEVARTVAASGPATHQGAAARLLARTGSDAALLTSWLQADQGLLATDQQARWAVVTRLAELGDPAPATRERLRDPSTEGGHAALRCAAAGSTSAAKAAAWQQLTSGTASNREFSALVEGFWGLQQGTLTTPWVLRTPEDLADLARRSGQGMGRLIGRALPALPLAHTTLSDLISALEQTVSGDLPTVAAREFNDHLDDLRAVQSARGSVQSTMH